MSDAVGMPGTDGGVSGVVPPIVRKVREGDMPESCPAVSRARTATVYSVFAVRPAKVAGGAADVINTDCVLP